MGSTAVPGGSGFYQPPVSQVIRGTAHIIGKEHANSLGSIGGHQSPILDVNLGKNVIFDSTMGSADEDSPMHQPEVLKRPRTALLIPEVSNADSTGMISTTSADEDEGIRSLAVDYFSNLFTSSNPVDFSSITAGVEPCISSAVNSDLLREFTPDDVLNALRSMSPLKALAEFFHCFINFQLRMMSVAFPLFPPCWVLLS
ncbi:hypothetical protein V6N11_024692 [Hibiscus sabdariffa]|uniref:Uncharacterized protein n=1 Tax=Hibiscus sabdariffa TaxID=183260 RepID=A0ABR2QN14_9ROSI